MMSFEKNALEKSNNKKIFLPIIVISNLFPLYGVIMYNWTIFSVVYIYWLELLIISFFQFLKIIIAQGEPKWSFSVKLFIAIKFLLARTGLFIFYLIFIVVFLGLMASIKDGNTESAINMFSIFTLKDTLYKITILGFILYNLMDFIVLFILNNEYKTSKPTDYNNFLDIHILIVHIVVVLGTFIYKGATEKLHLNHKGAMIACVCIFVVVKIVADIIKESLAKDTDEKPSNFI